MRTSKLALMALFVASTAGAGCAYENTSKLFSPTAPSNTTGAAGTTTPAGSTSTGGNTSTGTTTTGTTPASAFSGAWGSSTIAGLPLGNCADVKWLITAQTATSVAGTVTANCASGVTVAANLAGALKGDNAIDLTATGTLTAMGLPCQFNLAGTGTRQSNDTMKLDYNGTYCFGTVSGSENLRKFPNV